MRAHGPLWFSPPIPVKTPRIGIRHEINNVQAAAENLLEWPKRGRNWNKAVKACLAALAGDVPPEDVRVAFEAAAREEGMLFD
ncbi:DUF982 domain-containing protein [Mesorhizobium sp. WSM4313]|uniref:DUF982 domain-containing protein n=1 Tax=Mesorhizobium sp. WSM4313 TaxID=2029412 RepID=UPI000BAE9301|nr:DUF982 domain-containing protein [Mesorhizobium sp. WSM4313]PBB16525.1 hypothetical protein CK219_28540 [Mesorhizobium sp. WSM4313]